jgi:hypothetical protein
VNRGPQRFKIRNTGLVLKDGLRNIKTDRANVAHRTAPLIASRNHPMALRYRRVGAVHSIISGHCAGDGVGLLSANSGRQTRPPDFRQVDREWSSLPGELHPLLLADCWQSLQAGSQQSTPRA